MSTDFLKRCFQVSRRRLAAAALAGILALAGATGLPITAAQAGATYDATAAATVSLSFSTVPPGTAEFADVLPDAPDFETFLDLLLTGDDLSGKFAFGNATASGDGSASTAAPGVGSSQSATVSGSSSPGGGYSLALQLTNGFLDIDNTGGTEDILVTVDIGYSYDLLAKATDPTWDYAEATASIIVELLVDDGTDVILVESLDVLETAFTDEFTPEDGISFSDTVTLSFTVAAGEYGLIDIFVDAQGLAVTVAAPSATLIMALGLALMGAARRRRR